MTPSESRHGAQKFSQKARQLNAAVTELEGSDDDIVTSPSHSEPQTVPDLGAAVLCRGTTERLGRPKHPCRDLHLVAQHGHQLCVVRQSDGGGGGGGLDTEHFVPEFSRRHSDDIDNNAWTQNYLASSAFLNLDTDSDHRPPSPTRSEWTVPHTPERWLGPSPPIWPSSPGSMRTTERLTKKVTTRSKRRRVARSPSPLQDATTTDVSGGGGSALDRFVAESRTSSSSSSSSSSSVPSFNQQRKWNGFEEGGGHPCSCNVNTCSPLCLCLKLYDAGLKSKTGPWSMLFDDWKYYCCSMTASIRHCSSPSSAASTMVTTPLVTPPSVPSTSNLPKPLPLIVRRAHSNDGDSTTASRWLPPNTPEDTGQIVTTITSAFTSDDVINNNSHDHSIRERSTEWAMNCGPQRDHLEEPRPS